MSRGVRSSCATVRLTASGTDMPHKDPQVNREYQQRWRDKNRVRIRKQQRARREEHLEEERERLRRYAADFPERRVSAQRRHRLKQYGLTPEQYNELVAAQEGKCAVCATAEHLLHIDHDHTTGKVRGLLCGNCNRALGILKEDPERITALAAYAKQHCEGGDANEDRL